MHPAFTFVCNRFCVLHDVENCRPRWKDCEKNALLGLRKRDLDERMGSEHDTR